MWPDNVGHTVGRCRPHSGFMTRGKNATRVHNRYPVSPPFHICSLRGCVRSEGTVFCSSVLCKYFFLFSVLLIRKSLLKILIAIGQLICRMYFRVLHRFGCCSGSMETDKNSTTTSRIMRFDGACSFFLLLSPVDLFRPSCSVDYSRILSFFNTLCSDFLPVVWCLSHRLVGIQFVLGNCYFVVMCAYLHISIRLDGFLGFNSFVMKLNYFNVVIRTELSSRVCSYG